jgi:hypothetical protein
VNLTDNGFDLAFIIVSKNAGKYHSHIKSFKVPRNIGYVKLNRIEKVKK